MEMLEFRSDGVPSPNLHFLSDAQAVRLCAAPPRNENYTTRIISISKKHSWAPLGASEEMLNELVAGHNIMIEFLQIVASFQPRMSLVEEAFSGCVWKLQDSDVHDITYLFKYAELKSNTKDSEWSIRQIGVYQKYNFSSNQATWVLIFPTHESGVRQDLFAKLNSNEYPDNSSTQPLAIHTLLLSSRMTNWREYMAHLEVEIWDLSNLAVTVDVEDPLEFKEMYEQLSRLHYIQTRLAPLPPIFAAQQQIITRLMRFNHDMLQKSGMAAQHSRVEDTLVNLEAQLAAYQRNADFLISRVQGTIQLISDTIGLKSQNSSEGTNSHMLRLNKAVVNDSANMRVIALVTLIYLPSSFVGGFFGMGFFATGDDSGIHWVVAPYIWMYFLIAIPLTALTLFFWRWMTGPSSEQVANLREKDESVMV